MYGKWVNVNGCKWVSFLHFCDISATSGIFESGKFRSSVLYFPHGTIFTKQRLDGDFAGALDDSLERHCLVESRQIGPEKMVYCIACRKHLGYS